MDILFYYATEKKKRTETIDQSAGPDMVRSPADKPYHGPAEEPCNKKDPVRYLVVKIKKGDRQGVQRYRIIDQVIQAAVYERGKKDADQA